MNKVLSLTRTILILIFISSHSATGEEKILKAVATTGMVGNTVQEVGGIYVVVTTLMGPGVDPHLYKATQGDVALLSGADVVFYNGLHLEGKMGDVLEKLGKKRPVTAVTSAIDPSLLRSPPEFEGYHDPHIWFDPKLWAATIGVVEKQLSTLLPFRQKEFHENAERYRKELEALDTWCKEQISTIPKSQRVLITAHDAFGYFGKAYDLEVMGLQGISTASEYGLNDLKRVIDIIVQRKIKAIFVESSVSTRSIESIRNGVIEGGHTVAIGGELFSDAMGGAGTPEGTYLGMVRHNVNTIVKALK